MLENWTLGLYRIRRACDFPCLAKLGGIQFSAYGCTEFALLNFSTLFACSFREIYLSLPPFFRTITNSKCPLVMHILV